MQSLPLPNEGWPRRRAASTIAPVKLLQHRVRYSLFQALGVLLGATLAGCGGEIVTSPDALRIEPFWLAQLRAPQSVALSNGLSNAVKYQIRNESITWELDARQLTDTAIVMLQRALDAQGIRPGAQPVKTVTLRIEVRGGMAMFVLVPTVAASARLSCTPISAMARRHRPMARMARASACKVRSKERSSPRCTGC
jgi:hypothetical protein